MTKTPYAGLLLLALLTPGPVAAAEGPADIPGRLRLAVLPVDDLSDGRADLLAVDAALASRIVGSGFKIVSPHDVLSFLRRHRMRHTGGVRLELLEAMREELGADAVLLCSVDQFVEESPPRIALNARIVAVPSGGILWAREISLAGEERPGALGLREIDDIGELVEQAVERLLVRVYEREIRLSMGAPAIWKHPAPAGRYRPKKSFRAPDLERRASEPTRLAVLPFENRSQRTDGGGVIAGLLTTYLAGWEQVELIEPGEVRHMLLQGRIIQLSGLSLAQADFLREMLDVDLVVTGEILKLADRGRTATPEVVFSIWVIDVRRREVVWSGYSANRGDDGVVFFEIGRAATARELLSRMVRSAANEIARAIPAAASVAAKDTAR